MGRDIEHELEHEHELSVAREREARCEHAWYACHVEWTQHGAVYDRHCVLCGASGRVPDDDDDRGGVIAW